MRVLERGGQAETGARRGYLPRFSYDAYATAMCHDIGMISLSLSR